jgi:hypothetical protein
MYQRQRLSGGMLCLSELGLRVGEERRHVCDFLTFIT